MKSKSQKRRERRFKLQKALGTQMQQKIQTSELQSVINSYMQTSKSYEENEPAGELGNWTLDRLPNNMHKYFHQRYSLFSLFDHIRIDMEGWFSVTPEQIAIHLSNRLKGGTIIDAFCGVGGNTIQFAKMCDKVIAVDNNKTRLECARHNAMVYGCTNIEFVHGDYMQLDLHADKVFLSPPWGGIKYNQDVFRIDDMPIKGTEIFKRTKKITNDICYFLPRNIQKEELMFEDAEFEETYLDGRLKSYSVYYVIVDCKGDNSSAMWLPVVFGSASCS
ncbi:Trimethylguanosine synthase [Terramyces sp. JEL0728]|nr:Trimethylguanosine synthase [Terramyces sp. JEL0728]